MRDRLTRIEALDTYCPVCGAMPGEACRYISSPGLLRPRSTSKHILAARARIDGPTTIPHNLRHNTPARRLRLWLAAHGDIFIPEEP